MYNQDHYIDKFKKHGNIYNMPTSWHTIVREAQGEQRRSEIVRGLCCMPV